MIGRNRYVKPELFRHRLLRDAQRALKINFRYLYTGLWTVTDREGRFEWKPDEIQDAIDPDRFEGEDFERILNALANLGFIEKYRVGSRFFGWVPRWKEHQTINNRETSSRLPEPPAAAFAHHEEMLLRIGMRQIEVGESAYLQPFVSSVDEGTSTRAYQDTDASAQNAELADASYSYPLGSRDPSTAENNGYHLDTARARDPEADGATLLPVLPRGAGTAPALPIVRGVRNAPALISRVTQVFAEIQSGERRHLSREQERRLQAEIVFLYWQAKFDHPGALMDAKREQRIIARLQENDGNVGELLYALDGAHNDDFMMARGEHAGKRKYDGIENVLRDRGQIERFAVTRKKYREGQPHPQIAKLTAALRGDVAPDAVFTSPLPPDNENHP